MTGSVIKKIRKIKNVENSGNFQLFLRFLTASSSAFVSLLKASTTYKKAVYNTKYIPETIIPFQNQKVETNILFNRCRLLTLKAPPSFFS